MSAAQDALNRFWNAIQKAKAEGHTPSFPKEDYTPSRDFHYSRPSYVKPKVSGPKGRTVSRKTLPSLSRSDHVRLQELYIQRRTATGLDREDIQEEIDKLLAGMN